jgi:hypothetical protein
MGKLEIKNMRELMTLSEFCRGSIISELVYLERHVDEFLSRYFCGNNNDKRRDLFQLILATKRMTFNGKKEAIGYILKNNYKQFIEEHPEFLDTFEKIIPERNRMAHYMLDTSHNCVENYNKDGVFKLVNFEVKGTNSKEEMLPYTDASIRSIMKIIIDQRILVAEITEKFFSHRQLACEITPMHKCYPVNGKLP